MSDQTTTPETPQTTKTREPASVRRKLESGPHATREAAEAVDPKHRRIRLYSVTWPNEQPSWVWTEGSSRAVERVCKARGVYARRADQVMSPDAVASALAGLTPEQRQEILGKYAAAPSTSTKRK